VTDTGATKVVEPITDQAPPARATHLRVKVTDNAREGRPVVNINMPIGVVRWGMKVAEAFSPELKDAHLDWASINAMLDSEPIGKIVEVEDEAANKMVEVWIE
jgi:hypothetical protein